MPNTLPRSRGVLWVLKFELIALHWGGKPGPIRQIDTAPAGPAAGSLIDFSLTGLAGLRNGLCHIDL